MPLVLDNVTVTYRSLPAVHHVYARFDEGCSWAIYGPNGAGKSTLLKTIMRLMPCSTGEVRWEGLQRRELAYLPQQSEMDRSLPMTVFELTALGLWHELGLFGGLRSRQAARVMQALERVGMTDFAHRQIAALSTGQFQRVLFARMLVQDARFLLLDEPFNAMDAHTTQALLTVLQECVHAGKGVIAVVHDQSQARHCFHHALLLAREVIAEGLSHDVFTPDNVQRMNMFRQDAPVVAWCDIPPDASAHAGLSAPTHVHLHAEPGSLAPSSAPPASPPL